MIGGSVTGEVMTGGSVTGGATTEVAGAAGSFGVVTVADGSEAGSVPGA